MRLHQSFKVALSTYFRRVTQTKHRFHPSNKALMLKNTIEILISMESKIILTNNFKLNTLRVVVEVGKYITCSFKVLHMGHLLWMGHNLCIIISSNQW